MLRRMRAVAIGVAVAALAAAVATRPRAVERAGSATADAARFAGAHLPGATVRTARLATGAVVAVADRANLFDRSWGSSLLLADAARDPIELVDRVFYASRPLPLPSGEIVVERGVAGAELAGRVRVDELTLDAVDPRTHATRTIYAGTGFEAHLAALAGDELIVYLVQPGVASLRAIDWRSGRERVIVASLPPYAHDFAVDGGALLVQNRDDAHRERETVERIDLRNGNRTRMETH
ncbi:MAG: hypothetical protein JWM53_26 [bacterium]|nr:hypothetical protein [bacterium]